MSSPRSTMVPASVPMFARECFCGLYLMPQFSVAAPLNPAQETEGIERAISLQYPDEFSIDDQKTNANKPTCDSSRRSAQQRVHLQVDGHRHREPEKARDTDACCKEGCDGQYVTHRKVLAEESLEFTEHSGAPR